MASLRSSTVGAFCCVADIGLFVELGVRVVAVDRAFGPSFIWKSSWDPITSKFGALPMIFGTVMTSLIAIVLAAFIGIMAAVFLAVLPRGGSGSRFRS